MSAYNCRVKRVVPKDSLFTRMTQFSTDQLDSGFSRYGYIRGLGYELVYRQWKTKNGKSVWALLPFQSRIHGICLGTIISDAEFYIADVLIKSPPYRPT